MAITDLKPEILTGPPPLKKAYGGERADFRINQMDLFIANKGYSCWWSRAVACPCKSGIQTDQASPVCPRCHGKGWFYILPDANLLPDGKDAAGRAVEFNTDKTAVAIPVAITSTTKDPQVYEKFGQWVFGSARATIQSYNRASYRDRFQARFSTMSYSQLIKADGRDEIRVTGSRAETGLWTAVKKINLLRSDATEYSQTNDFALQDDGSIKWLCTPPTRDTRLTIHADFAPTWIVMDHVYAHRDTQVYKKVGSLTAEGQFRRMPTAMMVKLDFLVDGAA